MPSEEARDLYEAPLALIRPDQVVAWRGAGDGDAEEIVAVVSGQARAAGDTEATDGRPPVTGAQS